MKIKRSTVKQVLQVIVAILTTILGSNFIQSCM